MGIKVYADEKICPVCRVTHPYALTEDGKLKCPRTGEVFDEGDLASNGLGCILVGLVSFLVMLWLILR